MVVLVIVGTNKKKTYIINVKIKCNLGHLLDLGAYKKTHGVARMY